MAQWPTMKAMLIALVPLWLALFDRVLLKSAPLPIAVLLTARAAIVTPRITRRPPAASLRTTRIVGSADINAIGASWSRWMTLCAMLCTAPSTFSEVKSSRSTTVASWRFTVIVAFGGLPTRNSQVNSGGANACTGPEGFQTTHATAEKAAEVLAVCAVVGATKLERELDALCLAAIARHALEQPLAVALADYVREYNIALGQRRADAVKKMMMLFGASDSQIDTVSFGKEKPRNGGHDESSWQQNRRADIKYTGE